MKVICLKTGKEGTVYDSIENQILVMKGLAMKELKGIDENISIDDFYQKWERSIRLSVAPIYQDQEIEKFRQDLKRIRLNTEPETPAIPAKWCVRRTPENAEVLNAWFFTKYDYKYYGAFIREESVVIYWNNGFDGWDLSNDRHENYKDYPEITFEQWQTIPEHAEWLEKRYQETKEDFIKQMEKQVSKVEEREIIGYEVPRDMFRNQIKESSIYIQIEDEPKYYKPQNPNDRLLNVSEDGLYYSVRPFLTVAYE